MKGNFEDMCSKKRHSIFNDSFVLEIDMLFSGLNNVLDKKGCKLKPPFPCVKVLFVFTIGGGVESGATNYIFCIRGAGELMLQPQGPKAQGAVVNNVRGVGGSVIGTQKIVCLPLSLENQRERFQTPF